jgi:hypothetical protein
MTYIVSNWKHPEINKEWRKQTLCSLVYLAIPVVLKHKKQIVLQF